MKSRQSGILLFMIAVITLTGCVGCGKRETGKEEEGRTQEVASQSGDGSGVQGDGVETGTDDSFAGGEFPEPVPVFVENSYGYEVWKKEKTQIRMPGGVLFDGKDLLVCDMGNHCVVRLTTNGDFVESYGELGSEEGNFVTPTAILFHENEIYVLDSGNMRIQVFDMDMNFDREIWFEGSPLPSDGKYNDMAIAGDGTIYIAADASYGEGTSLFYIEGGELCVVPGGAFGYLAEQGGMVYAADNYRYYKYEKGYGWKPGENWVYQVDRTGLERVCELPYMYAPVDFVIMNDILYTLSPVWGKMNRVSMDGEPSETMFYIEEVQSHAMYLCVQDENTFYVADTQGFLYKVFRTEGEE